MAGKAQIQALAAGCTEQMTSKTTRLNLSGPPANAMERARAYASLWFTDHGLFRYFYNRPFQISDEMWRTNQPSPGQLRRIKARGIKTVINLRGPSSIWAHRLEREACEKLGLTLVDFRVKSRDVPAKKTLHGAAELFQSIEYPAIMHCKSGADRAGIMAALYLIMRRGHPVEEALDQLSARFGHFKQAKTGLLDHFFESYLRDTEDNAMPFMTWVDEVYDPAAVKGEFMASFWPSLLVDRVLRRE